MLHKNACDVHLLCTQSKTMWDKDGFCVVLQSELYSLDQRLSSADEYFDKYHNVLQTRSNKFAP